MPSFSFSPHLLLDVLKSRNAFPFFWILRASCVRLCHVSKLECVWGGGRAVLNPYVMHRARGQVFELHSF